MRKISIRHGEMIEIYVGKVDQDGNYEILKLTEAEAAVLLERLKTALYY